MESSVATLFVSMLFVAGLASVNACDAEAVAACGQQMMSGGAATNVEQQCAAVEKTKQCLMKALEGCPSNMAKQSMQALEAASAPCKKDDPCSIVKMQDCLKGLPMGEEAAKKADPKTLCPKIGEAKTCLQALANSCQDPNMKTSISQSLEGVKMAEGPCKDTGYEAGSDQGSSNGKGMEVSVDDSADDAEEGEGVDTADSEGKEMQNNNNDGSDPDNGASSSQMSAVALVLSSLLILPAFFARI